MKGKFFKKVIASVSAAAMLASMAFVIPVSAAEIYKQDFEDLTTEAIKTDGSGWTFNEADGGVFSIETDKTHYLQFKNTGGKGTRGFSTNISVTGQTEYVVEFDMGFSAGTQGGSTFRINTPSGYILDMTAGTNSTTFVLNGVETSTLTVDSGAWYHYKLQIGQIGGDTRASLTATKEGEESPAIDKKIIPISGTSLDISGYKADIGRSSYGLIKLDNLIVRETTADDEMGELETEGLASIKFTSEINEKITAPAEDAPYHKKISIAATGIYGGDLTEAEGLEVEWSTTGLEQEDGYISLTAEEGTENGTTGEFPGNTTTAYFNVRNGVGNYFGAVTAKVTYLEKTLTISTPFAVVGGASAGTNIAPDPGYPENMNEYADDLVDYQATSTGETTRDLVLNNWSIYGSNGARTLKLLKDEDGTKYLQFHANGGGGSTVAVYQLADQPSQYIVDMKVRFSGDCTFGHYTKTPNNTGSDPNWSVSYAGGTLTVGSESIAGLGTGFNRIVVSADESAGTFWVKAYDLEGKLLGALEDLPLAETAKSTQKYFSFNGGWPVDLNSFRIYYPTVGSLNVTGNDGVVQIPEDATKPAVTKDLSAVVTDTDGNKITGAVTWSLADEYAGITIEQAADNKQNAVLTVTNEAGPGEITVVASYGSTRTEVPVTLSSSGNVMVFTQTTSSVTIPFEEPAVTQVFAAEARDKDGHKIDADVTYEMVDDANQAVTVNGVKFDPATATLSVAPNAASKAVYIRASALVDGETLTARTRVNIHGLAFAFGSADPEDETLTMVTAADAYSDRAGYGFADISVVTDEASDVKGSAAYTFKAKVPNGNYKVEVTTSASSMTSEVVEGIPATTGISKSGAQFSVAVADGILDLAFPADSTLSKLTITQIAPPEKREKPMLYAIGDSTTNSNDPGKSWGNWMSENLSELPEAFSGFVNNGMAGRDSVNFYNQGRVETVLLSVAPGDYVTVNMGINSRESGEPASFYTLLDEYYVNAIIQRGAIPVIVTATPQGPVNGHEGNYSGGKFNCNRGDGAHNGDLRNIAEKYNLNVIELGQYGDTYFNAIDDAFIADYNAKNSTSFTDALSLVQSWYPDHNHYRAYLGEVFARYITGEVAKIANGEIEPPTPDTYTVTFMGDNATVNVNGEPVTSVTVNEGNALSFTVTPAEGYKVTSVKAGDTELTASNGVYTIEGVTADTTVTITTEKDDTPAPADKWTKYVATYKNGVLELVTSSEVEESKITKPTNTDTEKIFYWQGMKPYAFSE